VKIADLIAIAKRMLEDGTAREDVFAFLDAQAVRDPALASAVTAAKAMLEALLNQGNITDTFSKALAEVLALLKEKHGPVSDAPEIGL